MLWQGSAGVTAKLREGAEAASVPGMLLPDCPWPRAVTVIDAIAWAGRLHPP